MADEMTSLPSDQPAGEFPVNTGGSAEESSEPDTMRKEIADLESVVGLLKDQLLRKAAEFENYRKRVENENESFRKYAGESVITKILPVLDDFERSMKAHQAAGQKQVDDGGFMRGMELILNKLKRILELQGLKHFDVVGKPFDPEYHDALMQVHRDTVPAHTVIEEVERGYMLHDKVLRHARVIVSADAPAADDPAPGSETQS
jgi:molecular chaperone GrpE